MGLGCRTRIATTLDVKDVARCLRLLHDVRQLVGQQMPPFGCLGRESAVSENDMVTERISMCVEFPRRLLRGSPCMHPDP